MDAPNIELLKIRLSSVTDVLNRRGRQEKQNHISQGVADDFNSLRNDIATAFPELASALPGRIESDNLGARDFKIADATFLDLELKAEQLGKLLALAASGRAKRGS